MKRRMNQLFREDGRIVIVAMDHAAFSDKPLQGMIHPGETIRRVVSGGADTVMTTFGTATCFAEELSRCGLILTIQPADPMGEHGVEEALSIGADGIKGMVYPWLASDPTSVLNCNRLGALCHRWQMPFLAEVIPGGFQGGPEFHTPEKIAAGARVGAECGADMIKTLYTGSSDTFKVVTDNCYVPVIILGGGKMDSDEELLGVVKSSLEGGSRGVAMGNNIWRHPHPDKIVSAIAAVVHDGATVTQALKKLA
jgi:DhnA family fructose-bisphosphate aldolase class Ia